MEKTNPRNRWWLGMLAAAAMVVLALYPQITLRLSRGHDWQGSYAYIDTDEVAYSAYVNALADGRPRRNDPYTGRDDLEGKPQPESLFSIQFIPAYLTAWLVSVTRLNVAEAFTLLMGIGAATSTLAIFWLFLILTRDDRVSAAGALCVLCLGTMASSQGAISYFITGDAAYNYLPFLRRYIPLIPFPIFFLVFGLVWKSLATMDRRRSIVSASVAGLLLATLVYSYFFLWTAAIALAGCIVLAAIATRPQHTKQIILTICVFLGPAVVALIPYVFLLSHRSQGMDAAQLLTLTHKPDLFRSPEILGFGVVAFILIFSRDQLRQWETSPALFAISCALMPAVVFNQQVITGRSLQPIHYEQFIGNYVAMVAVVLALASFKAKKNLPSIKSYKLAIVAVLAFSWGLVETTKATSVFSWYNERRDQAWGVSKRLRQLSAIDLSNKGSSPVVVTSVDLLADDIPTASPDAVLWARHMHVFSGVSLVENKRRFYQLMYYTGVDKDQILDGLTNRNFYYTVALFGWDRANFNLTAQPRPVTKKEIDAEMANFVNYTNTFDRDQAREPKLSYLVTDADDEPPFDNLDKWYERSPAEHIGTFNLYRLSLKD